MKTRKYFFCSKKILIPPIVGMYIQIPEWTRLYPCNHCFGIDT